MLKYVRMHSVSIRNRIEAPFWIQLITYCIVLFLQHDSDNFNQFHIYLSCMDWLPILATWQYIMDYEDGFRDWIHLFLAMPGQIPGLLWHGSFVTKRLHVSHNDSSDRRGCGMMLLHLLSCHGFGWLYHRSLVTNDEDDERIILFWANWAASLHIPFNPFKLRWKTMRQWFGPNSHTSPRMVADWN